MQNSSSDYNDSSSKVIYQLVDVALPISLTPEVKVGKMKVKSYGEPDIEFRKTKLGNLSCEIIITQTISCKIPIEYGINSNIGEAVSQCEKNNCCNE